MDAGGDGHEVGPARGGPGGQRARLLVVFNKLTPIEVNTLPVLGPVFGTFFLLALFLGRYLRFILP